MNLQEMFANHLQEQGYSEPNYAIRWHPKAGTDRACKITKHGTRLNAFVEVNEQKGTIEVLLGDESEFHIYPLADPNSFPQVEALLAAYF